MTDTKTKIFNIVLASLAVATPVLAADTDTKDDAKPSFAKKIGDCKDGACERGHRAKFSDEQLQKMSSLKNQFLDNTASKRAELDSLGRQMKDVFTAKDVDRAKANDLESRISAVKADLDKARLNFKLDMLAVLTPEQRDGMRRHMLEGGFGGHHRHHGFGHHGHFKGGPGGPGGPGGQASHDDKA